MASKSSGAASARSYRAQAEAVTLLSDLEGGEQLAGLTYASAFKDPLMNTARQNVLLACLARVVAAQDARISELEAQLDGSSQSKAKAKD